MKLYTEEQARYFFECGKNFSLKGQVSFNIAQEGVTPIELPSEGEIERDLFPLTTDFDDGFLAGGKYVIKQIKKQVIP